jgi:hypothetical protein
VAAEKKAPWPPGPDIKPFFRATMHISADLAPLEAERGLRSRMSEDWLVENLRVTFFGVTGLAQTPLFVEIAGVPPAQINQQPPIRFHQETGNLGDAHLAVTRLADRLDVVLSDQPTRNTVDPQAPGFKPLFEVGPLLKSLAIFDPISEKATALIASATRVAFSITVIHQTKSPREAIVYLHRYLPRIDFDADNDLDLSFQINRPVRDRTGRLINRFAKWDAVQITLVPVTVGGGPPMPPLPSRPPVYTARAYLDVSSDAANVVPITHPDLTDLFRELRACSVRIVETGDSR